jgi:hypothetical protein
MSLALLIQLIVIIVVLVLAMWFLETYVMPGPAAAPYRVLIRVLVGLFVFLYILTAFGLWHGFA